MSTAPMELFPPPRLSVVEAPRRPLGRRTSQRVFRRCAVQQQACQTLDAWNWMAGLNEGGAPGLGTEAQDSAVNRAIECASLVEPPKEGKKAALSALLKATAGYGTSEPGGIGDVATFETGAVSLPDDVHSSPSIGALCPASASHHLEEFESMLRPLVRCRRWMIQSARWSRIRTRSLQGVSGSMLGSSMILTVGACSVGAKHPRCNALAFLFAKSLLLLALF